MKKKKRIHWQCLVSLCAFLTISVGYNGLLASEEVDAKSPVYAQRRAELMGKMQEGIAIFKNTGRNLDKDFYSTPELHEILWKVFGIKSVEKRVRILMNLKRDRIIKSNSYSTGYFIIHRDENIIK